MKIKLKESQLKRVLKEVGGYDDIFTMQSHAGNLQGELRHLTSETVNLLEEFIEGLQSGELSKDNIMAAIFNFGNKFQSDIKRLKELSQEIYVDDDFKNLIIGYSNTLQKILKYFKLLSDTSVSIHKGVPRPTLYGLGIDMSKEDLTLHVAEKLNTLGEHISKLGEMFYNVAGRYHRRLNQDN